MALDKNGLEAIIHHILYMSQKGVKSADGMFFIFEVNYGLGQEHKLKHQLKVKIGRTGDGILERVRLMMFDEE